LKKKWRILVSVVLIAVLAWRIDWAPALAALAHANWALWAAGLGVYLFAQSVSSLRWRMLAHVQGFSGSHLRYLGYYFIGMFFNLVLPTSIGGDMTRTWYLVTREGASLPRGKRQVAGFLSVSGDRLNGLFALIGVAGIAALCCPTPLPPWIWWTVGGLTVGAGAGVALLPWAGALLASQPRMQWLAEGASRYGNSPRTLLIATLLSFVVQVANVLLACLLGAALGLPVPPAYYGVLAPLVALLALLPISLNGMGLREAGTVVLLAPLGVSAAEAVTLAVLTFAVYAVASLGGGVVLLLGRFPRFEEVRLDDHAIGGDSDQGRTRQSSAAA
jgi:glycosyltransferase 2 family protein